MGSKQPSNLTILILSCDRQEYLLRNMSHWSAMPVTLLAVDGSARPIATDQIRNLGDNVDYFHLPESLEKRIVFSIDRIATKYIMLLGDDDFAIPSGVKSCVSKLEQVDQLVACCGRCIMFDWYQSQILGRPGYLEMENYQLTSDDPMTRLVTHFDPYTSSTVYAVVRTDIWTHAMSSYLATELPRSLGFELFFEGNVAILGKSIVIPELTWMRSSENPTQSIVKGEEIESFDYWWVTEEKRRIVKHGVEQMISELKTDRLTYEQLHSAWIEALTRFVNRRRKEGQSLIWLINILKNLFPEKFRKKLEPYFGLTYRRNLGWEPIADACDRLGRSGVAMNNSELEEIYKKITATHQFPPVDKRATLS